MAWDSVKVMGMLNLSFGIRRDRIKHAMTQDGSKVYQSQGVGKQFHGGMSLSTVAASEGQGLDRKMAWRGLEKVLANQSHEGMALISQMVARCCQSQGVGKQCHGGMALNTVTASEGQGLDGKMAWRGLDKVLENQWHEGMALISKMAARCCQSQGVRIGTKARHRNGNDCVAKEDMCTRQACDGKAGSAWRAGLAPSQGRLAPKKALARMPASEHACWRAACITHGMGGWEVSWHVRFLAMA
ncbi:hypothetical protein HAX54_010098 [Datura stramonium]|uniref:Uncharacterized protein n=1 Tax=Datura stramonium TaxID=4076 RepID=A0ABS8THL2_DATST|nr:hypothetical protein [Datura stramonium]